MPGSKNTVRGTYLAHVVKRNGRFTPPFFGLFFGHFGPTLGLFFSVFLKTFRPSFALFASFMSTHCVVEPKYNLPANIVGKGSVLVASEQDLEQRKDALDSRRIWRHGEGDTGRLAPGPDFRDMAFPLTQNPFSEVAHIAVINENAISSSDVSGQLALQSRHGLLPLPKRLDFGKSCHEINGYASIRNVKWVEELCEFALGLGTNSRCCCCSGRWATEPAADKIMF
jgi:hypothetical protein